MAADALDAVGTMLGHRFRDPALLKRALTHASHVGSQHDQQRRLAAANERLEFLGDALLGAAVAQTLYQEDEEAAEGVLSRRKARLVSRVTLARAMEQIGLLPHCRVGRQMGESWPDSVKANLAEAVLAAIYLDGGWEALSGAVERLLADVRGQASAPGDAQHRLQAWSLQHYQALPVYQSERVGGSDHAPDFRCSVLVGEHRAEGSGSSRRRSEAAAAAALLRLVEQPSS